MINTNLNELLLIAKEIWPGKGYYITEYGDIYSTNYKKRLEIKKLSTFISNSGYKMVRIKNVNYYVHRLVAIVYIPNPDNLPEVNHKDLDKLNNFRDNLEWVSASENVLHAKKNCKRHSKTSSNSGYLYYNYKRISHFDSLQQAKIYCKKNFNCTLSTNKTRNVNIKNNLLFLRDYDLSKYSEDELINREKALIKKEYEDLLNRPKEQKGFAGKLYKNHCYIGSFKSLRDANKYIKHDLKKTVSPNVYKYYDYEFVKQ